MSSGCSNAQTGSWFDLRTVTQLQLTGDCKFQLKGPNCEIAGDLAAPLENQGTIDFHTKSLPNNSHCPFHGQQTCKYVLLENELLMDCGRGSQASLTKETKTIKEKDLEAEANKGVQGAQKKLSAFYLANNNAKKAVRYLNLLAKSKNDEAPSALGLVKYYGSNGFKKSPNEAFKLNKLSADKNHLESQFVLGMQYLNGVGTKKDLNKAKDWLQKAALANYVAAQKELAQVNLSGSLGAVKKEDGKYWLQMAVDAGDLEARQILDNLDKPAPAEVIQKTASIEPTPQPKREIASTPSEQTNIQTSKVEVVPETRSSLAERGLFIVRPFLAIQENKATVPSLSMGFSPTLSVDVLTIRPYAAISLLNIAIGETFVGYELALFAGLSLSDSFFEIGYGMDMWPSPSNSAPTIHFNLGKPIKEKLFNIFSVKTVSLGYSQTFFNNQVHKIFLGATF